VRRHGPQTIISWTRVLSGGLRDPLVGRDILIGLVVGIGYYLIIAASLGINQNRGDALSMDANLSLLAGFPKFLAAYLNRMVTSIDAALLFFLLLFVLRVLCRREWLAAAVFWLCWRACWSPTLCWSSSSPSISRPGTERRRC
jgi:hypothetical protein